MNPERSAPPLSHGETFDEVLSCLDERDQQPGHLGMKEITMPKARYGKAGRLERLPQLLRTERHLCWADAESLSPGQIIGEYHVAIDRIEQVLANRQETASHES